MRPVLDSDSSIIGWWDAGDNEAYYFRYVETESGIYLVGFDTKGNICFNTVTAMGYKISLIKTFGYVEAPPPSLLDQIKSTFQMVGGTLLIITGTTLDAIGVVGMAVPEGISTIAGLGFSTVGGFLHSVGWKLFDDALYDFTAGKHGAECNWTSSDWGDIAWGSNPLNVWSYGRWGLQKDGWWYGPDGRIYW
ncbi:MAG: hypothetical protein PHI12_12780 [Dehalococcoidales bacterium]|nr:hypothetical protein [Dehalococcoidales bacterium]